MNSMLISLLLKGLVRGGITLVLMSIIVAVLYFNDEYDQARSTFSVALIIFFVGVATIIYDIDSISLFKRSVIHFFVMLITVYPILVLSGWFPLNSPKSFFIIFLYFICCGTVIYTIMLTIAKIFKW